MKRKTEVGDPCRTPIVHVISTVPKIQLATEYMLMRAPNMTAPHPNRMSTMNNLQGRSQEFYFGVSKTSGASKRQLGVWGRCKPPSGVRGEAPEILENSTLKRPQMAYF